MSPSAADIRMQLVEFCTREYEQALHAGNRYGDRKLVRRSIGAAQKVVESIDVNAPLREYVERVAQGLKDLSDSYAGHDEDDPDHWRVGGVRTVSDELARLASTSGLPLVETWVVHEDLLELLDAGMRLVRDLHACGSLAPLAVSLDNSGEVTAEAYTEDRAEDGGSVEDAIGFFRSKFERELYDEELVRAGAIFFHGVMIDGEVQVAHQRHEAGELVVWLFHVSGEADQALMSYTVSLPPDATAAPLIEYGPPAFSNLPKPTEPAQPTIELSAFRGIGLIIPCSSGVTVTNQAAGHACEHPSIEGVFVPLTDPAVDQQVMLEKFFAGPPWNGHCDDYIDEESADVIDEILGRGKWTRGLKVDRDRLAHGYEAWVWVTLARNAWFEGFGSDVGILTWQNSD